MSDPITDIQAAGWEVAEATGAFTASKFINGAYSFQRAPDLAGLAAVTGEIDGFYAQLAAGQVEQQSAVAADLRVQADAIDPAVSAPAPVVDPVVPESVPAPYVVPESPAPAADPLVVEAAPASTPSTDPTKETSN